MVRDEGGMVMEKGGMVRDGWDEEPKFLHKQNIRKPFKPICKGPGGVF